MEQALNCIRIDAAGQDKQRLSPPLKNKRFFSARIRPFCLGGINAKIHVYPPTIEQNQWVKVGGDKQDKQHVYPFILFSASVGKGGDKRINPYKVYPLSPPPAAGCGK